MLDARWVHLSAVWETPGAPRSPSHCLPKAGRQRYALEPVDLVRDLPSSRAPGQDSAQGEGSEWASGPDGATGYAGEDPSVCETFQAWATCSGVWLPDGHLAQSQSVAQAA